VGGLKKKEVGGSICLLKEKESILLDKNCCTQLTIYNYMAFFLMTSMRTSGSVLLKAPLTSDRIVAGIGVGGMVSLTIGAGFIFSRSTGSSGSSLGVTCCLRITALSSIIALVGQLWSEDLCGVLQDLHIIGGLWHLGLALQRGILHGWFWVVYCSVQTARVGVLVGHSAVGCS
jgi:hypothetical protein